MKKALFFILISTCIFAQQKFRLSQTQIQQISKINPDIAKNALIVERMLNAKYDPYISTIEQAINATNAKEKDLQKVRAIICTKCYEDEWKEIQAEKVAAEQKAKFKADSLQVIEQTKYLAEKARKEAEKEKERIEYEKYQDSVRNTPVFSNPYDAIKATLTRFGKNKSLSVFRKMDYNFAGGNIQRYMQDDMKMGFTDEGKHTNTLIVEKYIPKVSSKSESVTITYNGKYRKDIVGYYPQADEVFIIDSVTFTGTPNYIVDLFLNYWPGKVNIEGYKTGVIATKQLLGDHVSLIGEGGKYKITITKGNMDPNYETSFGINKKR